MLHMLQNIEFPSKSDVTEARTLSVFGAGEEAWARLYLQGENGLLPQGGDWKSLVQNELLNPKKN